MVNHPGDCDGDPLLDSKRDAVALWRALNGGDEAGAHVIARATRCGPCLAIQAVLLALSFFTEEGTAPGDVRAEIDAYLASMQGDGENAR